MHAPRRVSIAVASVALGLSLGACSSSSPSTSSGTAVTVQHLDVTSFAELAATPATVLLDVRTAQEFAAGHLAGARNLDFRAADFDAQLDSLPRATTYALYCQSDNRSGQALERMSAAGFTHVADLSGGIAAWTAAGRETTTG